MMILQQKAIEDEYINRYYLDMREDINNEVIEHSKRISKTVKSWGEFLGLNKVEIRKLELAAIFHDFGKLTIPRNILLKTDKLNKEEWNIMKAHPLTGFYFAQNSKYLSESAETILHHHERWDGTGYPYNLKGEEIPLHSRILNIVDSYDAMTRKRVYKENMSQREALMEIKKCSETQFDPELAMRFIDFINGK